MTDRELMQHALEELEICLPDVNGSLLAWTSHAKTVVALRERLAQPEQEPVIDKSAAIRIATALGWVPRGDTSPERVDEAEKQRQEYERGYADAMNWKLQNHLEHLPSGLEAAVKAEREACAQLLDDMAARDKLSNYYAIAAKAIRARGQA